MGFFSLEMARRVGPSGRVVAADVQDKMLAALGRRAKKAGVAERIELRKVSGEHLPTDDLEGAVDFVLAFAMVHEVPNQSALFADIARAMKPGGKLLVVEPAGHVGADAFAETLRMAADQGLAPVDRPAIGKSHAALLTKS
jgi:ubiquinone/menaquinone biosynthesis C-methylase UbiE